MAALNEASKIAKATVLKNTVGIVIGAIAAAIGLESFLIPNHLIDGGIVGLSIMAAHVVHLPLGLFLLVCNAPFIYLGYRKLGSAFATTSIVSISSLAILTSFFHHWPLITTDPVLAAIFGGVAIGFGVGMVIRYGGTLDGAEIVAILVDRRTPFSVGEIIMFMNLFIIGSAGFIFGWDKAMYSLVAYFVAYKVIDMTVEGLDESKAAWIISKEHVALGELIHDQLGRKVTYITAGLEGSKTSDGVVLSVITRFEEMKLKSIVRACDPNAFLVITNAHDVMGKNFKTGLHQ